MGPLSVQSGNKGLSPSSGMEEGLQAAGCQWDAGQPATGTAASFGGLRGSSNSKDSTQTEAGIDPTPRRKPGRPPQTKTCRVCALDLAEAGLKGYYLVSAAGHQDGQDFLQRMSCGMSTCAVWMGGLACLPSRLLGHCCTSVACQRLLFSSGRLIALIIARLEPACF